MQQRPQPPSTNGDTDLWQTWSRPRLLALAVMLVAANFAWQVVVYLSGGGLFLPVLVGALGGVLAPLAYFGRRAGWHPVRDFGLDRPGVRVTAAAVVLALAALAPTSILAQLSLHLHPVDPDWAAYLQDNLPRGPGGMLLAFLSVVLVAPLAEELVFRGMLQRVASSWWGPAPAALISSLVFGLVHGEPWFLFGLVGVGLMLAFVYEATRSVTACWIAHAVHNAISLGMMAATRQAVTEAGTPSNGDLALAAGSLVVLGVVGRLMWSARPVRPGAGTEAP